MITCRNCGASWDDSSTFCGSCGTKLGGESIPTAVVAPAPSDQTLAAPARHSAPSGGLQTYRSADSLSLLGPHLAPGAPVSVTDQRGSWVHVQDESGASGWADGRTLVPPVVTPTRLSAASTVGPNGWAMISALGAIAVIVGAAVSWYQGASVTSFDVPVGYLFDKANTSPDPKTGYFLVGLGIAALALTFMRNFVLLRRIAGALALGGAVLFCIQINSSLSGVSSADFTDVIAAGPWIVAAGGIAVALAPNPFAARAVAPRTAPAA